MRKFQISNSLPEMPRITLQAGKFQIKQKIFKIINVFLKPNTYNLKPKFGFSLIELLVVVTLIGIIGVITTQVFILALRTQVKSEIIKEVKQNGDYALSVMESMIRNAADIGSISSCNTTSSQLSIKNPDGFKTIFDCSAANGKIASISGTNQADPTPTGQPLTNNKVAVSNCNIRIVCPTPPINPKYVYLEFKISQAGLDESVQESSSLDYQSTISLGNYQ